VGNNNGVGNVASTISSSSECREELDGVERGEGAPLSHLTASRAKAPRRRPPSSQHLRHHAAGSASINASQTFSNVSSTLLVLYRVVENNVFCYRDLGGNINFYIIHNSQEDNLSNGRTDTTEQIPDDETDGLAAKARRKAPWVIYWMT